jgi:hypothetical protein
MESCISFVHENPFGIFRLKNSRGIFHHASLVTPSERLPSLPEREGLTDNNLKTEIRRKKW